MAGDGFKARQTTDSGGDAIDEKKHAGESGLPKFAIQCVP
jgi:hypothetical protein